MPRRFATHILFALVAVSLALPAPRAFAQAPSRAAIASEDLSASLQSVTRLVEPAVVEIFTTSYAAGDGVVPRTADLVTTQRASGSGVIVDPDGYIVTNAHVVRGAQRLRVELPIAGRRPLDSRDAQPHGRAAQIVGIDLETDLAVIKVDERNLPALAFGDSDELQGRAARARVRQSARPPQLGVARRGQRRRAAARARVADDLRADRRVDQPGQQRRPAGRPARPARRHQHADRRRRPAATRASGSPRRATSSAPSTSRSGRPAACAAATSASARRR